MRRMLEPRYPIRGPINCEATVTVPSKRVEDFLVAKEDIIEGLKRYKMN